MNAKRCTVAIIGDVMIDHYIIGRASRLSPEARCRSSRLSKKTTGLGGCNVAAIIAALGYDAVLVTPRGQDVYWHILETLLNELNVTICPP